MLETESFPKQYLSIGLGCTNSLSQLARFTVPFLVNEINNVGVQPIVLVSILLILCTFFSLSFLKEPVKEEEN